MDVHLPQSLLKKLAEETDPNKIDTLLKDHYYVEMERTIKQFNRNTGALLYDFRGLLQYIGAQAPIHESEYHARP